MQGTREERMEDVIYGTHFIDVKPIERPRKQISHLLRKSEYSNSKLEKKTDRDRRNELD